MWGKTYFSYFIYSNRFEWGLLLGWHGGWLIESISIGKGIGITKRGVCKREAVQYSQPEQEGNTPIPVTKTQYYPKNVAFHVLHKDSHRVMDHELVATLAGLQAKGTGKWSIK
jgi:hypothetical protein